MTLLASVVSSRRQNRLEDLTETQAEDISYIIGAAHYFWQGFQIDLYDRDLAMVDSRCLDEESENEIAEIYYAMEYRSLENTFDAGITLINLFYDDYVTCNYEEALSVFMKSCEKSEEACRMDSILTNLEDNIFEVVAVASSIGDVSENFSYMD